MENLDLKTTLDIDRLMSATNIVPMLDKDDVGKIGSAALEGYQTDLQSRAEWDERMASANKLAMQVYEEKSFPWPNAASVKFPLITVAAMQYQAKAYPALVSPTDLVKARVIGLDPDGQKSARALRIATHMTWQNLEQDEGWEEDHDKLLLVQSIIGCAFKKRVYEPGPGKQQSRLVLPANLVVNYFSKNLHDSPRYTHTYYLTANNIRQRELDGRFAEVEVDPTVNADNTAQKYARDERQGLSPPPSERITPWFTGEQYCWLDLDDDGYQEPYIVTFDIDSGKVRRIVARYLPSGIKKRGEDIYKITPVKVFIKYPFIPSPDGGFYDLGLGSILGPINESVNTAINQMLDAGTMATLGGGFLGRGFKGKGGAITFQPNQWYPVDAPGDDLRKNILPLPIREPSNVLLQLLGLLIQYGERIVSATDLQMGENIGQNTPAETARTMNENGARVYSAIYKRTWRSEKEEFSLQYDLNRLYLEVDQDYTELTTGKGAMVMASDYQEPAISIRPAADPHVVSDTQRIDQAKLVASNAVQLPGHNKYASLKRLYQAMQIPNIDEIMPPPQTQGPPGPDGKPTMQPAADFPPMPNPKMMDAQLRQKQFELEVAQFKADRQDAQIQLQLEVQSNQAEIMKLYAQAEKALAEAKGVATQDQINLINAQIQAVKLRNEGLLKALAIIQKDMEHSREHRDEGKGLGGMGAGAANGAIPAMVAGAGAGNAGAMAQPGV